MREQISCPRVLSNEFSENQESPRFGCKGLHVERLHNGSWWDVIAISAGYCIVFCTWCIRATLASISD